MIQIALTHALALYSAILGLLITAIWVYTELTVRRHHRFLEKQFLWRCVFCGYTYLDESAEKVSQCPRCASFNSLDDKHARFVPVRVSTHGARTDPAQPLPPKTAPSTAPGTKEKVREDL